MAYKKTVPHCLCILMILVHIGCTEKEDGNAGKPGESPVVAAFGDATIRLDEIEQYVSSRPLKFSEKDLKKALEQRLNEMITSQVLFREALDRRLDEDPEIKLKIRRILSHPFEGLDPVARLGDLEPVGLQEVSQRHTVSVDIIDDQDLARRGIRDVHGWPA